MNPGELKSGTAYGLYQRRCIYAMDIDNDNNAEIIGNFKNKRLNIWEHNYCP